MNPDLQLSGQERAELIQISAHAGYRVLHKIMRAEVDKFNLALLNADASDDHAVLAAHKITKAAAQFYTAVTNRVNEEVILFQNTPRPHDKPFDATEKLIDLGERAVDEYDQAPLETILGEMNVRER